MTIWDTIFKAVFVVAVPITLAVYACVYVGERAEHDVARPRPPRRRPRANPDRAELDSKIIKMSISAQQQAKNYWYFS